MFDLFVKLKIIYLFIQIISLQRMILILNFDVKLQLSIRYILFNILNNIKFILYIKIYIIQEYNF